MTDQKNENQKAQRNAELKSKGAMGATAAFGAVLGAFAGAAAQDAMAATPQEVEVITDEAAPAAPVHHTAAQPQPAVETVKPEPTPEPTPGSTPEPEPEPTPEPAPEPTPEPTPDPTEPTVEVVGYETVNGDSGPMDIAAVSVDDQVFLVADVDHDGWADVIACDVNGNGELEASEMEDVSGQGLAMEPLHDAYIQGQEQLAYDTTEPDYINNGNVEEYMA